MTARASRGTTLLEVVVAVAVLATGIVALDRLVVRCTAGVAADVWLTHAMLRDRALLADAAVHAPQLGHAEGAVPGEPGVRWARDVASTPHPALREVRVRVTGAGEAVELVELIRVPRE